MANLKEIRNRIVSVQSTMQITSAMKMVSAAKLKRAQDKIVQLRPYANKLSGLLASLSSSMEDSTSGAYAEEREIKKVLMVVINSNRGLCGAFNANIVKKTNATIASKFEGKEVKVLAIGKKAAEYFAKKDMLYAEHNNVYDALTYANVAPIAESIMAAFVAGEFDHVEVVFNAFLNAAVQTPTVEQFLPVVPAALEDGETANAGDYIFEPAKEQIILDMIPKSLKTQLYKSILDSNASEHGARMTAMHKATDNAGDLRDNLKLTYNKARQAAITNEILEIVGGAEALKS
jgi:F-type H+-transporting ATPase subunit gamma